METFIAQTLGEIKNEYADISEITFVLPSKRAGGFLMNELKNETSTTRFAPIICSIEEFIEELSQLKIIDSIELLFKSYEAYLQTETIVAKEDFETYSNWAITLLNDFSEMDRYLVDPDLFFEYLAGIKTLERWGVKDEKSQLIRNYLEFWNSLPSFYENIQSKLLTENTGYQGMVYRKAAANIDSFINTKKNKQFVFIGFNALNTAEQSIIQKLLEVKMAKIYWDTDAHFLDDEKHSASHFIRKYTSEWKFFKNQAPKIIAQNYVAPKHFQLVEVQKNIGQVKFIGELLSTFSDDDLNKTAIVLGDETLLVPLLYSLPENVAKLNVTMGIALKNFPAIGFFQKIFSIQQHAIDTLYYKDILALLNHPLGRKLLDHSAELVQYVTGQNITHISTDDLFRIVPSGNNQILRLIFENWNNDSSTALQNAIKILNELQRKTDTGSIEELVLRDLRIVFNEISALDAKYSYLKSIKNVANLFSELVAITSLNFKGDAYNGLQLMGVLETRVLDFENVIITSVNEGIFPSGKSNASFITYDLKQQFNLPLFSEKDAIYTYHFYRLLQRAKKITLIYNSHSEGINSGEKSRFIRQIEVEKLPHHSIEKQILSPKVQIKGRPLTQIKKTPALLERLKEMASVGFSPSALTSYIRNPIEFYFQRILKLNELDEVEETVAANTLGTIIHDTLETFYKPLTGQLLAVDALREMKSQVDKTVTNQFLKTYKSGTFNKGKNLITFEVAKRYISNFIDREINDIEAGNTIKILKIEAKLELNIPIPELDFPVKIRGIVDRVDTHNGELRIIDYKTGSVAQRDVEIVDWEELNQDYKFSKAFQVLAYTLMMRKEMPIDNATAGIISFKKLSSGFLKFGKKTQVRGGTKSHTITNETLERFTLELKNLITEICNPNLPFTEKETN